MMGRRSRHRPDEVAIDGFLLLDTGDYELVTALVPLDVFWKMKALDILGHVRTENRARAARLRANPQVGSVWSVDGGSRLATTTRRRQRTRRARESRTVARSRNERARPSPQRRIVPI